MEIQAWDGPDNLHPDPPPGGWRPEDLPGFEPASTEDDEVEEYDPWVYLKERYSIDDVIPRYESFRDGWDPD